MVAVPSETGLFQINSMAARAVPSSRARPVERIAGRAAPDRPAARSRSHKGARSYSPITGTPPAAASRPEDFPDPAIRNWRWYEAGVIPARRVNSRRNEAGSV